MRLDLGTLAVVVTLAGVLALGGCASAPAIPAANVSPNGVPAGASAPRSSPQAAVRLDRALEDRILALDPERITPDDVANTLAKGPAPRLDPSSTAASITSTSAEESAAARSTRGRPASVPRWRRGPLRGSSCCTAGSTASTW